MRPQTGLGPELPTAITGLLNTQSVFITTACEGFCIMEHTIFKLFSGLQRNTFNMKPQSFRVILKCLCVLGVKT